MCKMYTEQTDVVLEKDTRVSWKNRTTSNEVFKSINERHNQDETPMVGHFIKRNCCVVTMGKLMKELLREDQ